LSSLANQAAAQHCVQRTRAGFRLALMDSAPLAGSTFWFFLPNPALAVHPPCGRVNVAAERCSSAATLGDETCSATTSIPQIKLLPWL